MKIKGVGTLEQHVEKIVLAVVSAVFLVVIAVQLLTQPNLVTVGKAVAVPPGKAYDEVARRARTVQALMDAVDWPRPEVKSRDLVRDFREARQAPVVTRQQMVALGAPVRFDTVSPRRDLAPVGTGAIAAPEPPSPSRPVAASFWSTIDPAVAAARPELMKLLPPSQPFDKLAVSVEATYDGTALHKAFQKDPDGDGAAARAMPPGWYRDTTQIFGVRLERQEQSSTGEWTGDMVVPVPPGMIDLVTPVREQVRSLLELNDWLGEARRLAEQVQRPTFYRTIAGEPWVPPADALARAAGLSMPREVEALFRRLDSKKGEVTRAQAVLDDLRNQAGRPPSVPGGRPPTETIVGGQPRPGAARPDRDHERKIAAAEKRVKELTDEFTALEVSVRSAGFDPATREALPPVRAGDSGRPAMILESPSIRVWAHDVHAKPGRTYRYRVSLFITNPLFGRGASLPESLQALARQPLLQTEPSPWSDPIETLSDQYFFITGGSDGAGMNEGAVARMSPEPRAGVEVYRMFYGFYRKGALGVEPGDFIAADVKLPDANRLPIWDIEKLKPKAEPAPAGPALLPPAPPGSPATETVITAPPAGVPQPSKPTGSEPEAPVALPEGAKPWSGAIRVALDLMLLDVARAGITTEEGIAGKAPPKLRAFLRDGSGRLVVRSPDDDRTSPLYAVVSVSAKKGETQGEPPKPKDEGVEGPNVPGRPTRPTKDDSGGGGGGGGGG